MIFTFFSLIIFFGILFIFGWQLARFILSEKRIEALIPLAAILGIITYLSFLVSFSYLIDIQINFYLLLVLFIFLSYFFSRVNRKKGKTEWTINRKWRKILFGTAFLIIVLIGIVGIRRSAESAGFFNHLPLAATIAEGNFPIRALFAPDFPEQYHYGYNLFLAAITKVTNLPIWFSYDLQNSLFIGIIFLLGFLLIKDFCKDNFRAYLAALVMILGGNLNFLYGIGGLSALYQKFVLHLPVEAPFRFLHDIIFGSVMLPGARQWKLIVYHAQAPWIMLGFALTTVVIYLYFRAINDEKNWFKISFLASIMFSFLVLGAEIFFGVLCIVFLIYPLFYAIFKKDWQKGKFYLKVSFLILFLGLLLAFFQGGAITQTVKQVFFGEILPLDYQISITLEYLSKGLIFADENVFVPIFGLGVFLGWGWLIIFIIPAAIYVLKKYFQLGLFILLLILTAFFLPLVVTVSSSQGHFMRITHLTALFWNLLFGLFLGWLFLFFKKKWQKSLLIILILGVIFQGLFYLVLFSIFPVLERGRPLIWRDMPRPNSAEFIVFDWVKKNTTIKDYFLTFGEDFTAANHNAKFIIYTGRFAPGFFYGTTQSVYLHYRNLETRIPQIVWYQEVLQECSFDALKTLNYSYLYVNEYWSEGLEEKCLVNNNLELKLEAQEGNNFARIYKIVN